MNLCSLAIRLKNLDKYSYRPMEISFSKLFSRCYLISLSSHDFNIEILQRMILQRNFEPKPSSTNSFKWAISANLVRTETWWFIRHKKAIGYAVCARQLEPNRSFSSTSSVPATSSSKGAKILGQGHQNQAAHSFPRLQLLSRWNHNLFKYGTASSRPHPTPDPHLSFRPS